MRPEQISDTFTAAGRHMIALNIAVAEDRLNRIDDALTANERSVLRKNDYIPQTQDAVDMELMATHRAFRNSVDDLKIILPESGEILKTGLMKKEITEYLGKLSAQHYATSDLRISVIDDVWNGTGPLRGDTVEVLGQLREVVLARRNELKSAVVPDLPDVEEIRPFLALMSIYSVEATRALSKLLTDQTGITVDDVPLPSRDDLRDLYAFVKDNEQAILEVIATVSEDEQDNGLTL